MAIVTTAAPESPETANIFRLGFFVVTHENHVLVPNATLGDIYKSVMLPSGVVALLPVTQVSIQEVEDRIEVDKIEADKHLITLQVRYTPGQ